jgi:beta-lactamase regulating signal transducer with metallopeptidase domain
MAWLSWIVSNVFLALLLAAAAWLVQWRLRRPAVARVLWVLVLVKLVTPPLVGLPFRLTPGMACRLGVCGCEQHAQLQTAMRGSLPWILLAAWSAGAGATGWIAWRRWTRFRQLISHARIAPPEWQTLAASLATELSIRCPPQIMAVPGRMPPLVIPGRPQPLMLLPADLMGQLNSSQRAALLLHELVHIRRGDHLVRILELMVGVGYWWLPMVGLMGRQLRDCEEACCDAAVVARLPHARRDYARLLLDVVDFASAVPVQAAPQATAMSAACGLERRLLAILDTGKAARRSWPVWALAVCLACAILPCGLHYDIAGRPAAANAADKEPAESEAASYGAAASKPSENMPAAGPTASPKGGQRKAFECCCPS